MNYAEIYGDLFSLHSNEYILAHCISADFALGAGIAKSFANIGVKQALYNNYSVNTWTNTGYCLITNTPFMVANLVTKRYCYEKPTYQSLAEALIDFRNQLKEPVKIGMPCIGCGLDRLQWENVRDIIYQVFEDFDCDIIVCKL